MLMGQTDLRFPGKKSMKEQESPTGDRRRLQLNKLFRDRGYLYKLYLVYGELTSENLKTHAQLSQPYVSEVKINTSTPKWEKVNVIKRKIYIRQWLIAFYGVKPT